LKPKLSCINGRVDCYMTPVRTVGEFEDANTEKHPRYGICECDCSTMHTLDMLSDTWFVGDGGLA